MGARIVLIFAVVYTVLIAIFSLVRLDKISVGSFSPTDKMLHSGAYFGMAFIWFLYLLFKKPDNYNFRKGFVKISALVIIFGMLIEVLQGTLTQYRQPEWSDILANTIGVVLAFAFFILFLNFMKNVKHRISSFL